MDTNLLDKIIHDLSKNRMDTNLLDKLIYELSKNIESYSTIRRFANHDDKAWIAILKVLDSNIQTKKRNLLDACMISVSEEEDE
jgi:hypothetical protein